MCVHGGLPTGLAHDQRAGLPVPRLQAGLEEAVQTAGGHLAEIERGGPKAAQVADPRGHMDQAPGLRPRAAPAGS